MKPFHPFLILALCIACVALFGCPGRGPVAGDTRTFDGIQFQWCPPGTFAMGSPAPEVGRGFEEDQHQVTLKKGYWLAKCELSQTQWTAVMNVNPSSHVGGELPVEQVSWDSAQQFIALLNNASTSGGKYRLPTEAEWEYACRAGTTTRFYWGDDPAETQMTNYAWYRANSGDESHPMGWKLPNAWGLQDMSGNVIEWVQDWYGAYPVVPMTDPQGPSTGTYFVLRGGSFGADPVYCRSAYREPQGPSSQLGVFGFRLLRESD